MRNSDILGDFQRFSQDDIVTKGVFNIDIGIHFPYSNQSRLFCEFGLIKNKGKLFSSKNLFQDVVKNHRYPNKNYVTLSKKFKRAVSRTGYPVISSVKDLNKYKMFILRLGIDDERTTMCFPLKLNLTDDKPICGLECHVYLYEKDQNDFGIQFMSYEPQENGDMPYYYLVGKSPFGFVNDWATHLMPYIIDGDREVAGFSPDIEVFSQSRDHIVIM